MEGGQNEKKKKKKLLSKSPTLSELKNLGTVLQKRLHSFYWSLLEISVMKRVSVVSQKTTHIYCTICCKEAGVPFLVI